MIDTGTDKLSEKLSLTDRLAIDRTVLANERTLLSYVRTALALLVVGATPFHISTAAWLHVVGGAVVALGGATLVIGGVRYGRMRGRIAAAGQVESKDRW